MPGEAQTLERPVVTCEATPARLPAVHNLSLNAECLGIKVRLRWLQHVVGCCKPFIGSKQDFRAQTVVRQVGEFREARGKGSSGGAVRAEPVTRLAAGPKKMNPR